MARESRLEGRRPRHTPGKPEADVRFLDVAGLDVDVVDVDVVDVDVIVTWL
jgi:hypothetical protein